MIAIPSDVTTFLAPVLDGIRETLAGNLAAVYVRGSLALGDFIPATSDIDLFAVTEHPVSAAGFSALSALHQQLAASPHPFARRLEIAYVDRGAARRFEPGLRHPTLGQGETLQWSEHRMNWILERWTMREHGVALIGPDPPALFDPVSPAEIKAAVHDRLCDWVDWANQPDDPDWQLSRGHKAYVVETICRALHTLATGAIRSKPRGVAWALETLPEPWRSTVQRSQGWRTDETTDESLDPEIAPEVQAFVRWAGSRPAFFDPD